MAGSNQDRNQTPSPVEDQNRQQQQASAGRQGQLGQTPGPDEQPEQDGSARRQQEQGVVGGGQLGGDQNRPQGSNRSSMSGGSSPNQGQSLEGRSDNQSM